MLQDLPFTGTTKVINKGVDIALVIRPDSAEAALQAAKICGVCGISTAVLEVTQLDPPDQRTLEHFCTTAGRLVFADQALLEAHRIPDGTMTAVAETDTVKAFTDAVSRLKRRDRHDTDERCD